MRSRAAREAIAEEIKALQDGLEQKLAVYADEARPIRSASRRRWPSAPAVDAEYAAQVALLKQEGASASNRSRRSSARSTRCSTRERRYQDQINQLSRQSLDQQAGEYQAFGNTITGAFNSQLHGLLSGTENWHTAFKNILEDLLIKFIEFCETSVVQYVAAEAAKTTATTPGVAARTGAEQAGAAASLAAQGAAIMKSILSSAAEAFAGVFGFLAPIMGPPPPAPQPRRKATVASMAGAVASADIGMWSVPEDMLTLVHHNELVMPAAQAGAFRDMLSSTAPGGAAKRRAHPSDDQFPCLGGRLRFGRAMDEGQLVDDDEGDRRGGAPRRRISACDACVR